MRPVIRTYRARVNGLPVRGSIGTQLHRLYVGDSGAVPIVSRLQPETYRTISTLQSEPGAEVQPLYVKLPEVNASVDNGFMRTFP